MAVHWWMVIAVYPFWASVAMQVGRLLRLQGSTAATHIQRRVCEQCGERETISRRVRYILRSYLDWGVLQEAGKKGVYSAGAILDLDDNKLIAWIVEAFLQSREGTTFPLKGVLDNPSLFPFRFKPIQAESLVASSTRLETLRHGLNEDLIMLIYNKSI